MVVESLPERRRRLVRADLARVALELFGEHGFDSVTVDDIAEAAGISPRTFFRYFAAKEDVVLEFERKVHERLLDAVEERPPTESPVVALRNAYVSTSHVPEADRARVVLLGRILAEAPMLLTRAQGRRSADSRALVPRLASRMGVDPERDARPRVLVAAMSAVAAEEWDAWVRSGGKDDPAIAIAAALALLEQGFSALECRAADELREEGRIRRCETQ